MWKYMKMLEYPVNIKTTNAKLATAIISQLGGQDGEMGASTRYLSQRYAMPDKQVIGVLTDIGTEESVPQRCKYSLYACFAYYNTILY
ncbi:MAG: manganese catalase family protein [Lachnospiraceae bacterium]|nr:manganese catalase family protein [Lachnospiraceae bacterium]